MTHPLITEAPSFLAPNGQTPSVPRVQGIVSGASGAGCKDRPWITILQQRTEHLELHVDVVLGIM